MTLARVTGTVVANLRNDGIESPRFLLVEPCDEAGTVVGEPVIALDLADARRDEMVLFCKGSSCRWTEETDDKPVDVLIVGIVDEVDVRGEVRYRKS